MTKQIFLIHLQLGSMKCFKRSIEKFIIDPLTNKKKLIMKNLLKI